MPKRAKPKPRRQLPAPGFRYEPLFSKEQAAGLANICGREDEASVEKLHSLLDEVSDELQLYKYLHENDVSPADQRKTLRPIAKSARLLITKIDEMGLHARKIVTSTYQKTELYQEDQSEDAIQGFERDLAHLKRFEKVIEIALADLSVPGGRPTIWDVHNCCRRLIGLYEGFTGRTFTFDNPRPGGFITPGTQFVAAATQIVLPNATVANLTTAMKTAKAETLRAPAKTPLKT